jgi:hypothetical protein
MKKTVVFLLLATLPGEGLKETVNLDLPASPEHRRAEFTNDARVPGRTSGSSQQSTDGIP